MADIDKSGGAIYQRSQSTYNSGTVSPGVAEAIDKIFPKSPSKFLQNPFSSPTADPSLSLLSVSKSKTVSCTVPSSLTVTDTSSTATAIFTGLSPSTSGTKSPIMSSAPVCSSDLPSSPASSVVSNCGSGNDNQLLKSNSVSLKTSLGINNQSFVESPKVVLDGVNNLHPEIERNGLKEPVKKKKKKKYRQSPNDSQDLEKSFKSSEQLPSVKSTVVLSENLVAKNKACGISLLSCNGLNSVTNSSLSTNENINHCADSLDSYPPSVKVLQKLPKVNKRKKVYLQNKNIQKYLRKKFLPCFVVAKKLDNLSPAVESSLDLETRVEILSRMCSRNKIDCPHKDADEEVRYKNIFEDVLITNSEDEFVSPRGRSLRKRNQAVSYVEPTEEDLLRDFSLKRRRSKHLSNEQSSDSTKDRDIDKNEKEKHTNEKEKLDKINAKGEKNIEKGENSTGKESTGSKIAKDTNLVYVYPKGAKKSVTSISTTAISKTTTSAPVTTLSLPGSVLNSPGVSVVSCASLTKHLGQPIAAGGMSPQYYMVKIDGKDFLVPIMTGSMIPRNATPPNVSLFSSTNPQLSGAGPRTFGFPATSSLLSKGINPRMSIAANTQMLSSSLPRNILSATRPPNRSTMNAGGTSALIGISAVVPPSAVTMSTTVSQSLCSTSLPQNIVSTSSLQSVSVSSILNSLPTTAISSSISSLSSLSSSLSSIPGLIASVPTSLIRNLRPMAIPSAAVNSTQVVASSVPGNQAFRIVVPACTATGMPARIATLGPPPNSSPLTRMALSSSLLPQRKRSAENLSPEKRAAKRRRLEQKYPLPPGVVIKTDPDEPPKPVASTSAGLRSLLRPNIQVISAGPRGGAGGLQNVRIITHTTGLRQMRLGLGSNIIIRAPNSSSGALSSIAALVNNRIITTQSRPETTSVISSAANQRPLTSSKNGNNSDKNKNPSTEGVTSTETTSTSSISTVSTISNTTSSPSSDKITTLAFSTLPTASVTSSVTTAFSSGNSSGSVLASSDKPSRLQQLDSLKANVEAIKTIIKKQESLGLQSERLKKLKDVLLQKQTAMDELEIELESSRSSTPRSVDVESEEQEPPIGPGISPSDPLVID